MATVKTTCPSCGEVEQLSNAFHLVTYPKASERAFYEFTCPECEELVARPADMYCVIALRRGKVKETVVDLPDEALEGRAAGDVISWDDVLDFTTMLYSPHWSDAVDALGTSSA